MSTGHAVREAAALVANGLALVLMVWWIVDMDGRGEARVWQGMAAVARALAEEFGQLGIEAERRYWEVVT